MFDFCFFVLVMQAVSVRIHMQEPSEDDYDWDEIYNSADDASGGAVDDDSFMLPEDFEYKPAQDQVNRSLADAHAAAQMPAPAPGFNHTATTSGPCDVDDCCPKDLEELNNCCEFWSKQSIDFGDEDERYHEVADLCARMQLETIRIQKAEAIPHVWPDPYGVCTDRRVPMTPNPHAFYPGDSPDRFSGRRLEGRWIQCDGHNTPRDYSTRTPSANVMYQRGPISEVFKPNNKVTLEWRNGRRPESDESEWFPRKWNGIRGTAGAAPLPLSKPYGQPNYPGATPLQFGCKNEDCIEWKNTISLVHECWYFLGARHMWQKATKRELEYRAKIDGIPHFLRGPAWEHEMAGIWTEKYLNPPKAVMDENDRICDTPEEKRAPGEECCEPRPNSPEESFLKKLLVPGNTDRTGHWGLATNPENPPVGDMWEMDYWIAVTETEVFYGETLMVDYHKSYYGDDWVANGRSPGFDNYRDPGQPIPLGWLQNPITIDGRRAEFCPGVKKQVGWIQPGAPGWKLPPPGSEHRGPPKYRVAPDTLSFEDGTIWRKSTNELTTPEHPKLAVHAHDHRDVTKNVLYLDPKSQGWLQCEILKFYQKRKGVHGSVYQEPGEWDAVEQADTDVYDLLVTPHYMTGEWSGRILEKVSVWDIKPLDR